jgi:Ankyrin repeats (3 copies)
MGKKVALVMLLLIMPSFIFSAVILSASNSPQIKKFFMFPENNTLKKHCASFFIARYGCVQIDQRLALCSQDIRNRVHEHIDTIKRFIFAHVGSSVQEAQADKLDTIILQAVEQRRIDILKVIIEYLYTKAGYPAICLLAANDYYESCRHLLEHGEDVNRTNVLGKTALICAAQNGNEATVKLLLQKNANSDLKTVCNKDAIELASEKGYANIVSRILHKKIEQLRKN